MDFWIRVFIFPRPTKEGIGSNLFPRTTEASALGKDWSKLIHQFPRKKLLKSAQPISQVNLAQCTLCWQFDDQKDIHLALRGFSVIQRGRFYDTEALSTIKNLVFSCNP